MGEAYPSAQILGVDLSPIQPHWVPSNVKFLVDDAESPWVEPENHYDLVHLRFVTPAFRQFPTLLERAYKHIAPGGWIEIQELLHDPKCDDGSMPDGWPLSEYFKLVRAGLAVMGTNMEDSLRQCTGMSRYGFTNVQHEILKLPIGTWPKNKILKQVGMYARTGIEAGLEAMALGPLCRGLGKEKEEVENLCMEVRRALEEGHGKVHAYLEFHIIYGQKLMDTQMS